ncbi:DUF4136 domain-containing protein [Ulvibacter litoralis]|uniref:DUF4136 domain-containing protein n=1 Tax=Ulvibacter litoralis TaxID=227084 RepID=A0A1G7GCR3_9FLAO|nr:DUF4136 domain-containing protein [Ulvibacter litoralis]GHC56737.1 hypothetical protein GCM10008083_21660 [Ulvibacter litoralis]SDE85948.1 protein of unknown function [Ulvibacter litoralis]
MKAIKFLPLLLLFVFTSCATVRVASDYDKEANFNNYNSFAFYKPGIDKAKISDLDKKRILRAIESGLTSKGMIKSDNPTLLVSIFTKEKERVDVYNNNFGYGWGWNPWYYGGSYSNVSRSTEGSLYVDLIDAKTNELVWQGVGTASLITSSNIEKKEERIREIVQEILTQYPPGTMKK